MLRQFIPLGLLKLTASDMVENGDGSASVGMGMCSLDDALKTLHEAETKVKEIVAKRFEEAVREEDLASVERFFKIFPLINMHDEGLRRFTMYLCSKVRFYSVLFYVRRTNDVSS